VEPGTILYLNGPSSSGKHSIIYALQELLEEPYISLGIDQWFYSISRKYIGRGSHAAEGFPWVYDEQGKLIETKTAHYGQKFMRGLYAAVAALSMTGNNVIVDDVMMEAWMAPACAHALKDLPSFFIGVYCDFEVALRREQARGNRPQGLLEANYMKVHQHGLYDFTVDTSDTTPEACASAICAFLQIGHQPTAFRQMAQQI
jgi:chloramphenicol 3-O phosphotransferase